MQGRSSRNERQLVHMQRHEELISQTHDALASASQAYRLAVEEQVKLLQQKTTSHQVLVADMKVTAGQVREKILSVVVNRRIQIDDEELRIFKEGSKKGQRIGRGITKQTSHPAEKVRQYQYQYQGRQVAPKAEHRENGSC